MNTSVFRCQTISCATGNNFMSDVDALLAVNDNFRMGLLNPRPCSATTAHYPLYLAHQCDVSGHRL